MPCSGFELRDAWASFSNELVLTNCNSWLRSLTCGETWHRAVKPASRMCPLCDAGMARQGNIGVGKDGVSPKVLAWHARATAWVVMVRGKGASQSAALAWAKEFVRISTQDRYRSAAALLARFSLEMLGLHVMRSAEDRAARCSSRAVLRCE